MENYSFFILYQVKTHIEEAKRLLATNFRKPHGIHLVRYLGASYDDFRKEIWVVSSALSRILESIPSPLQIREHVDGTDLETLMKNPSLCPSLRSPEERMRMAVGIAKVSLLQKILASSQFLQSAKIQR